MKFKLALLSTMLLFVSCDNSSSKDQEIIDNARVECIKLNQKYNQLYQVVMSRYISGNSEYESAAICLQEITKELLSVNKALKIDCKHYDENGKPTMMQNKDGGTSPVEIIPNELSVE